MSSPPPPLRPTAGSSGGGGSYHRRPPLRGRGGLVRRPRARRCKTKLVYSLMDRDEEEQRGKRLELELEVSELETALDREQRLGTVLRCSLQGRVVCHCCLAALVPNKVIKPLLCSAGWGFGATPLQEERRDLNLGAEKKKSGARSIQSVVR
jgi:hypothetical protein